MAALALMALPVASVLAQPEGGRQAVPEVAVPQTREERLDALFERLQTAESERAGKVAEEEILRTWLQSGSPTIDLLMEWTLTAMDEENYPLALDFLDRITSIEPDYVEGWNKRATIHYLNDEYGKSLADIERALALEPRHFGALAGLGTILRELGDEERALAAYRQALAYDPYMEHVQEAIDELSAEGEGQGI